ncbi:MAG: AAA family ATPase [Microthrixaceae bacterium]
MAGFAQQFEMLAGNVEQVIQGKGDVVRLALVCLLAEGHLLIEDVPGVGKTMLARALAASTDASWSRIQFTPDLLPSDVTGVTIFNQATQEFEFRPGAVFANVVVGDEINRASPKTQSALLEVMEEHRVTADAETHFVPRPFMVIATQNPIEMEGTYSLPEAQVDRFLLKASMGYPDLESEVSILETQKQGPSIDHLEPVMTVGDLARMIEATREVTVSPELEEYIVQVASATRELDEVRLGVSPRGSLSLLRAARAAAAAAGRSYVIPEDVKALAPWVLSHRLILTPEAELQGFDAIELVGRVLASLPVPRDLELV